ncbi:uncharacterized protein LOC107036417 [Diachasma alloeum]|uniref:uncharacterized protein LOC107036417 n=1 Tax=Diachasma alloeum TaxID=454923 RepID=UPI0007381BF4|nr:uncharacterized protein LOC107036417 [Diachasma alloeum]
MNIIKAPELKRGRKKKIHPAFDSSRNERKVSRSKRVAECDKVKEKTFEDAENTSKNNKRGKKGRKALADVNRLSMAGPVKTIDRPPTPIKASSFYHTSESKPTKCLNPFAKSRNTHSADPKAPPNLQNTISPILFGMLTQTKRSPANSQWETLEEIEIAGDDSDDCIEILSEERFLNIISSGISPEINNNGREMPKLKKHILEQRIAPARPRQTEERKNDKLRIREVKIYHEQNFSVRDFLERSKNPYDYFFNANRICSPNSTLIDFLTNFFPNIRADAVERMYATAKYNMSFAAFGLNRMKTSHGLPRDCYEVEAENISQLQEMKFVHNFCKMINKNIGK